MTTSSALIGVDNKVDDALKHYGVKGMKWGKKTAKSSEEDVPVASGGSYMRDEDLKKLEGPEADALVESYKQAAVEAVKKQKRGERLNLSERNAQNRYKEAATKLATIKKNRELEAFKATQQANIDKTGVKVRYGSKEAAQNGRTAANTVKDPTQTTFRNDITTADLLARREERRRKAAKHDEMDLDDHLMHYGVKGMRWGVRRELKKKSNASERAEYIAEKDAKWRSSVSNPKKAVRVAKRASREATKMTKELNAKYKDQGYKIGGNSLRKNSLDNRRNKLARVQYDTELKGILEYSLDKAALKVYKNSPTRLYQVNLSRNSDGTVSAKIAPRQNAKLDKQLASITRRSNKQNAAITKRDDKLKHSEEDDGMEDLSGLEFKLTQDSDGFVTSVEVPGDDLGHDDLDDLDDYLMHYGVKGMKWGVRKDDRGKIKSVVKRTPLRGKNEKGPIRDFLDANDYGGTKNHKAVARAYKTARPYVKQGLRNLNKDERYRDKDLTNEKSKLVKQYHQDVSDMVTSKLNMAAVVKAKRGDKLVPAMDYNVGRSNEPQIRELNSHNQFKDKGTKRAAKIELEKDMNVGDAVLQVGKGLAKRGLLYAAASQAVGTGIIAATGLELIFPEYSNPITRSISGYDGPIEYTGPPRRVRHSDDEESGLTIVFDPIMDEMGHITDVTFDVINPAIGHADLLSVKMKDISPDYLAHYQASLDLDDYLMHYGVKGMRWGVRKDGKPQGHQGGSSKSKRKPKSDTVNRIKSNLKKTASNAKKTVSKITERPKPKPKAKLELDVEKAEAEARAIEAQRNSNPTLFSPDTTKTMLTDRTRTGGMTDAELKATIQRMHLETAYAKLVRENTPKTTSQKLKEFAKETATEIAKQQVKRVAGEFAGNLVNKAIGQGLADAKDQNKKDDSKPRADTPKPDSKPRADTPKPDSKPTPDSKPRADTPKPDSKPKPAPTWRPTPPGPGRPPNKPPKPTWRPTGSPRITPNTSNYVFGDRGRNYKGTRRAQDIIDNHATVTVAELMERRKRRERL